MRQSTVLPSFPAPEPLTIQFRAVLRYDAGNFPHALRGWLSARAYGHSSISSLVKLLGARDFAHLAPRPESPISHTDKTGRREENLLRYARSIATREESRP
jgi:hypothetical protein